MTSIVATVDAAGCMREDLTLILHRLIGKRTVTTSAIILTVNAFGTGSADCALRRQVLLIAPLSWAMTSCGPTMDTAGER